MSAWLLLSVPSWCWAEAPTTSCTPTNTLAATWTQGRRPAPPPGPDGLQTSTSAISRFVHMQKTAACGIGLFLYCTKLLPLLCSTPSLLFSSTHTFLLSYPAGNVIDCVPVEQENYKLIFFGPKCLFCIIINSLSSLCFELAWIHSQTYWRPIYYVFAWHPCGSTGQTCFSATLFDNGVFPP